MGLAYLIYGEENRDESATLYPFNRAPTNALFPGEVTWWVDLMWSSLAGTNVIACPTVGNGFGIALNHPELTAWRNDSRPKMAKVKKPSESIPIADAGLISNIREKDPNRWVEKPKAQFLYWRTPTILGLQFFPGLLTFDEQLPFGVEH